MSMTSTICAHEQVPKPVMKWCSWAFGGLLGTSHPRRQVLRPPQAGSSSRAAGLAQARQVRHLSHQNFTPVNVSMLICHLCMSRTAGAAHIIDDVL